MKNIQKTLKVKLQNKEQQMKQKQLIQRLWVEFQIQHYVKENHFIQGIHQLKNSIVYSKEIVQEPKAFKLKNKDEVILSTIYRQLLTS